MAGEPPILTRMYLHESKALDKKCRRHSRPKKDTGVLARHANGNRFSHGHFLTANAAFAPYSSCGLAQWNGLARADSIRTRILRNLRVSNNEIRSAIQRGLGSKFLDVNRSVPGTDLQQSTPGVNLAAHRRRVAHRSHDRDRQIDRYASIACVRVEVRAQVAGDAQV